jgi:hypothetical protein
MLKESSQKLDTVRLQDISYAYRQSAVLNAAVELDLFTQVSDGMGTLSEIATALDVSMTNAERLLVACEAIGLVAKDGERFTNAPDVERFLVKGKRSFAGPWMKMATRNWDEWGNLEGYLRSKGDPCILGNYEGFAVEDARAYHQSTYSIGMGAGRRFAKQCDLSTRTRILDLGGGSGCYCITAAQAYPNLEAIVFDLPSMSVIAGEFIEQHGLSDRIQVQPGDFTKDKFPGDVDVVIMASNLPQYNHEIIQGIVNKAFDALLPGGEMHLIGETLNDDGDRNISPALWGMNEAILGSTGIAHSESDVAGYLVTAGFTDVTANEFIPGSLSRVVGHKLD